MLLSETTEYNDDDAEAKVKAFKSVIKPSSKFTVKKEGFADMLYVTTKDAIKFKEDKKHYGTLKFLAIALGTIQSKKRHTNCIFTISLRHSGDTYWFEANVPYLEYNTEFESYTYDLYKIRLTEKDVNDKLNLIVDYCINNPIVYARQQIDNSEIKQNNYIQLLISNAINDFKELMLLCDVSSI